MCGAPLVDCERFCSTLTFSAFKAKWGSSGDSGYGPKLAISQYSEFMKLADFQVVTDRALGEIYFPARDVVMAPSIRERGIWEEEEVNWCKANVRKGNNCLNIGANVGYFTILMSQLVGAEGSVIAFEPNPEVFEFLEINTQLLKNVKINKVAVGDRDQVGYLYLNRKNYGDSRMFNPKKTLGGGKYTEHGFSRFLNRRVTKMKKIDSVVKGSVDVALIDTQGFDHLVIAGMQRIIFEHKPRILTEFVPQWIKDLGFEPSEVLETYSNFGYEISSPDMELPKGWRYRELCDSMEDKGMWFLNLSLVHPENP